MASALTGAGQDAYVAGMTNDPDYNATYYAKHKKQIAARRKTQRQDPAVRERLNAAARRSHWAHGRPETPARVTYSAKVTVSTLEPLGRVVLPTGKRTNIYAVAQLAELLGKHYTTIPLWEKNGVIPKPLWTQKALGQWFIGGKPRLYTAEEMRVYEKCRPLLKLPFSLERSVFSTTVHEKIGALSK